MIDLNQAYKLNLLIDSLIAQREECISLACKCTASYDKVGSGSGNASQDKLLCKIADLQREIDDEIDRLVDVKRRIDDAIKQIGDPQLRAVLVLRYLCYKKWDEIADIMHYSYRHTMRLHNQALKRLQDVT